jgi:hypothetical protein
MVRLISKWFGSNWWIYGTLNSVGILLTWYTQSTYAVILRSAGVWSFLVCARNEYGETSLSRFSTAVPESTYNDHYYYPLCNTHFADSSADMCPTKAGLNLY